jgi:hypothetical protein
VYFVRGPIGPAAQRAAAKRADDSDREAQTYCKRPLGAHFLARIEPARRSASERANTHTSTRGAIMLMQRQHGLRAAKLDAAGSPPITMSPGAPPALLVPV